MQNLISNSIKFGKEGLAPHIIIKSEIVDGMVIQKENPNPKLTKLSESKKYYHIKYKDNGIGFRQEYSERIFEVFQRLMPREEYPGTGIGLAIVKKIVGNHNGVILASSVVNKGTQFDIYIPVN